MEAGELGVPWCSPPGSRSCPEGVGLSRRAIDPHPDHDSAVRRASTPASARRSATAHFRNEQAALKVRYLVAMEKKAGRSKPTGQIPRLEVHPQGVTIDCGEGIANLNHE